MSGFDIRLVFTLPPRDSTQQYKRCVHLCNNFPCIITLPFTICALITEDAWYTREEENMGCIKLQYLYYSEKISCHNRIKNEFEDILLDKIVKINFVT